MTKYYSQNSNGQATMANSQPIVIASDQTEIPVNLPDVTSTDGATAPAQALVISGVTSGGVAQTIEVNASGHVNISDGGGSITVDATSLPLPTGAATETTLSTLNTNITDLEVLTGAVNETAPASDTASSGLNGRLQRVAQRLTSLIALLPTSLGAGGGLKVDGSGTALPVSGTVSANAVDATASGTITTQNLVPAGTATAGSAVEATIVGQGVLSVQVTGTYTGALSLQYTVDGTTWITNSSLTFINVNTGAVATTIASAATGIFQADCSGFSKVRITGLAAMTGTATVTLKASAAGGIMALDQPLPTGTNTIGSVTLGAALPAGTNAIGSVTTAGNIPNSIADVASAAITTTTTTSAFTPTSGSSYQIVIPVTAVSGTSPTYIVGVEESDDSGTNWYNRYTFPTITATGIYRSPILKLRGNRVRYVQTLGGTTPSFTRAVSRLQRQFIDFGSVPGKLISAASTNATSVKPTPCELVSLSVANINAAARYLKIYDKASAPTVGTDTPVATFLIPGATTGSGSNIQLGTPMSFNLGFAFALTTGIADSDTGAVAANEIVVNYQTQ